MYMSTEIIDFKTPNKLFELEVQGFVVLSFDLHVTTLIELAVCKCDTMIFAQQLKIKIEKGVIVQTVFNGLFNETIKEFCVRRHYYLLFCSKFCGNNKEAETLVY